jgi:hypothetical protein
MLYRREIADALAAAASLPDATWNDHLPSLIAALARDTQLEFVPLFDDVLAETLIKMLDTTSAALLEALFSCWGFLFKYLQRHFVTSISDLFLRIERLFAHRREHVRRFIAQGFAFLVRKLPRGDIDDDDDDDDDIDEDNDESGKKATKSTAVANGAVPLVEFWRFVRSRVALSKHVSVGVAQLLLETWRSTANRFHSRAADMLGLALEVARDAQDVDPAELVAWRACLDDAFTHSMSHGRAEPANASFFLTQLCAELDVAVKSGAAADANGTWLPTTLAMWSRKKQQRFLTNLDPLVDRLTGKNGALSVGVLSAQWQSRERVDASLLLARTLIIGSEARDGSRMAIAKSQDHVLGALMPSLASTVVLRASVLASIDTFLETAGRVLGEKRVRRAVVQHVRSAVVTLSSLLAAERESLTLLHWLAGVLPYISDNDTPLDGLEPALQCALLALRTPLGASSSVRDILLVDAGLRCHKLAHVSSTTSRGGSSFLTLACATADRVAALLADEHCAAPQRVLLAPVLEQACAACEALVPTPRELRALLEPRVDSFLTVIEQTSMPREPTTLRAVARALECCVSAACTSPIDSERVARITSLLAPELSRSTPMARISTSQCIAALLRLSDASDADLEAQVAVFEALVLLETTKFDRTTSRVGSVKLKSLETVLGNADLPSERREAALHGAFGVYFIRFAEFWGIATELLVAAAHTDLDLFWRVVWPRVQSVSSDALTSVGDALALDSASAVSAAAAAQYAERVHVTENRTSDDVYVKEAWSMLLKVGTPLSGKADEVVDFILQFGEQVHVVLRDAFNRELAAVAPTRVDDDNDAEAEADADADVDEPMDDNNNDDDDEDSAESVDAVSPILATDAVKKLGRVALCKSLELFATFRDVGAVEKRDDVCELLLRYVSRPESDLQLASFKCLLLFKPRSFADIAEPLRYLVSGSLRNALSEWRNRLDRSTGLVPAAERDEVLSLMSRLLIGRLLALKGGSGKNKYHDMATRSLVFGFVGGLDLHETWAFVELLFAPVAGAFTRTLALDVAAEARCDGALRRVPHQERELTVELMRQIFKTLPALVNERFAFFGSLLLALLRVATRRKYSQSRRRTAQYRFLSDCHSRVRELMVRYGEHADIHVLVHRWLALTTPGALERNANHGWSQFRCVLLLSETPALVAEYLATPPALALVHAALGTLGASETNATQRSDVLELIENLLKACRIDAGAALGALQPHISTLVRVLRGAVERRNELVLPADMRMSSERVKQLTARFARRQLYVLSRVAAYVSDAADAVPLVELLLPFLHAHEARSSVIDVLGTVATLLSNVPPPIVEMFAASAQTLFSAVEWARPVRDALTRSFTAAAATGALPSLGAVAPLLVRLNAFSDERLDESDYEVQSVALRELSELSVCNMIAAMPRFALPPVLHTLLQLMRGDNLSLRVAATACVCVFVSALARDADADLAVTVVSEFPRGSDEWHAARTDAVHGVIFGAVLDALQRRPVAVRSGFHRVLGALVEHWPNEYGDMSALCAPISASVPVDFFEAIVGVQSSQLLALGALATGAKQWLPERVTSLFVPLLHRMILDADAKRNGLLGTHLLRTLASARRSPRLAALSASAAAHARRGRDRRGAPEHADVVGVHGARLVSLRQSTRRANKERQAADAADACSRPMAPKFAHNDVQTGMLEDVLPMLYSLLGSKRVMRAALVTSAKVRAGGKKAVDEEARGDAFVAIAEATVKVLVLLPSRLLRAELPMLLTRLVSRLNDREFDAREAARSALCGLCAAIGPTYVAQVVHELRTSLLRGFQQHVLGYTLHSILLRLQQSGAKPGEIDPAIEDIVTILLENIVGAWRPRRRLARWPRRRARRRRIARCRRFVCSRR